MEPITSEQLQTKKPLTLPNEMVDTKPMELIDYTKSLQDKLKTDSELAKKERDTSTSDIQKIMQDIGMVESKQGQYETQAGADTSRKAFDDLQSSIELEQRRISNFVDRTLEDPNMIRGISSRKVNEEQRRSAALLADLSISQQVAGRNYDRAVQIAQRKVDMELAPLKQELEAKKFLFEANKDVWSAKEKSQIENMIKQEDRAYEEQYKEKQELENLRINVLTNQAPQSIKKAMEGVKTRDELLKIPGVEQYLMSPADKLDLQLKGLQIKKIKSDIDGTSASVIPKSLPNGKLDVVDEVRQVIDYAGKDIPSSSNVLGVLSALQKFALSNTEGQFIGTAPIRVAGSLRSEEKRAERISNRGDISAIELKVQQWASGASLTKDQEKMVKKLTPDKNDTDFKIREKINSLTNFMQQQVRSELATKGIQYEPTPVDYFKKDEISLQYDDSGNIVFEGVEESNSDFFNK